jgi:hypothetical protein
VFLVSLNVSPGGYLIGWGPRIMKRMPLVRIRAPPLVLCAQVKKKKKKKHDFRNAICHHYGHLKTIY